MVAFMHTGTRLTAGYRYTTLGDATLMPAQGLLTVSGVTEHSSWDSSVPLTNLERLRIQLTWPASYHEHQRLIGVWWCPARTGRHCLRRRGKEVHGSH